MFGYGRPRSPKPSLAYMLAFDDEDDDDSPPFSSRRVTRTYSSLALPSPLSGYDSRRKRQPSYLDDINERFGQLSLREGRSSRPARPRPITVPGQSFYNDHHRAASGISPRDITSRSPVRASGSPDRTGGQRSRGNRQARRRNRNNNNRTNPQIQFRDPFSHQNPPPILPSRGRARSPMRSQNTYARPPTDRRPPPNRCRSIAHRPGPHPRSRCPQCGASTDVSGNR